MYLLYLLYTLSLVYALYALCVQAALLSANTSAGRLDATASAAEVTALMRSEGVVILSSALDGECAKTLRLHVDARLEEATGLAVAAAAEEATRFGNVLSRHWSLTPPPEPEACACAAGTVEGPQMRSLLILNMRLHRFTYYRKRLRVIGRPFRILPPLVLIS